MKYCAWLTAAVLVLACDSEPWANMSQSEIEVWKKLGYDAKQAQKMKRERVSTAAAADWEQVDLVGWDAIGPWKQKGFSPAQAGEWRQAGFEADDAAKWSARQFKASEAREWRDGGFSLGQASKARGEGLAPIGAK